MAMLHHTPEQGTGNTDPAARPANLSRPSGHDRARRHLVPPGRRPGSGARAFSPSALALLVALSFSLAGCSKESPRPTPETPHLNVSITGIEFWATTEEYSAHAALQISYTIRIDSLPDGEYPLGMGICSSSTVTHPQLSDTTLSIYIDTDPDYFEKIIPGETQEWLYWPFQSPAKRIHYRAFVHTSKGTYYSEPVDYTVPAIVPDDNVTDLPVVFHVLYNSSRPLPQNFAREFVAPTLEYTNLGLRNLLQPETGIGADTHIRLVRATADPSGRPLAEAGIHPIAWDALPMNPETLLESPSDEQIAELLWDPNRYINVWIFPYPDAPDFNYLAGIATFPTVPSAHPLEGLDASDYYASHPIDICPGVTLNANYIYKGSTAGTMVHELGHALGLFHVFSLNGCGTGEDYCADTPDYDYPASPAAVGNMIAERTACDGSTFYGYNIMDYNGYGLAFTPDQNARIQHVLQYGYFIPGSETARRGLSAPSKAPAGLVRPTPRVIATPVRPAAALTAR